MQTDKSQIVDLLRTRGDDAAADRADRELPDQVDIHEHAGVLGELGVDPMQLASQFAGGGGLGNIAGT
ncbi:hypothetical protein [Blastococcus sp. URHD0036]|uniref:hypothetical protein n=1 Tax=Blastococcus sp. URHD0036 TaxID=1380356 RepID=UPI000495A15A|nr:hypothetical protein [Blastococcus sp. URHD0036]